MTDLKPCPFCGSKSVDLTVHSEHYPEVSYTSIKCRVCDIEIDVWRGRFPNGDSHTNTAIAMWNKRATDELINDMIDNLKSFMSNA